MNTSSEASDSADTGSLRRGVALLKLLASAGPRGLALTEAARHSGYPHPTVHRVLRMLIAERLAVLDAQTRRYRLGPLAFELGVAGSTLYDIRDLCEPAMDRLAEASGDTVYLVVRSGFDAVCLHRVEGAFPVRALVLEVGSRRPLGVGAGGLAILSAMGDEERAQVIERVAPLLGAYGHDTITLAAACEESRRNGHAGIRNRVSLGIAAVGVALRDGLGQPMGALSVAAMSQRMTAARMKTMAATLADAARSVEARLKGRGLGG